MSETAVSLHHVIEGDGPWVTLAHSLASDMRLLEAQAKLLSRRFRVLQLDMRGHGGSPVAGAALFHGGPGRRRAGAVRPARHHADGLARRVARRHGRPHPRARPPRRHHPHGRSPTPPPATPKPPMPSWRERIEAVRQKRDGGGRGRDDRAAGSRPASPARAGAVSGSAAMIRGTPTDGFIGCCEAIIGYNVHAEAWPDRGAGAGHGRRPRTRRPPPAMAQAIADGIPGARQQVIESAAHQSNIEQPDTFNAAVEQFLAE